MSVLPAPGMSGPFLIYMYSSLIADKEGTVVAVNRHPYREKHLRRTASEVAIKI